MNIKSQITIEIEKDGHIFSFNMPVGAPFGKAYDACFEALQKITEFAKTAADQAKQQPQPVDESSTN